MKIAYVVTRADAVGGASIHVRDLAAAMKDRGHDVIVLVGGHGAVVEQLHQAGVPHRILQHLQRQIDPVADAMAFRELINVLNEIRPHLVSTHTAKAGWLGRAACARLRIPVVYTPHGLTIGDRLGRVQGVVFTAAERLAGRWSDAIVCVSEFERGLAIRNAICPIERLHTIHNGVRGVPKSLRADPGSGGMRIACLARMEAPKDHATLLRAFALAGKPWILELIGDGPQESGIRALAESLGISSRIVFRGYLPEPAEALAGAQLFVLSSRSEGFPRSILEAMRAGLPVIASDVGGVREAVQDGISGTLVPSGAVQPLADALLKLMLDSEARQRMGDSGHQTWRKRFQLESMVDKTEKLYENLVSS